MQGQELTGATSPNPTNISILHLRKLLCTLPVTSCSAERSFSKLKLIKTPSRSAMTTVRLSGLTLLYVHCDIAVDSSTAIDEFARHHQRWMQMAEILEDQDHDH